jgi:nucleotide-binding universal stress UspA family protein
VSIFTTPRARPPGPDAAASGRSRPGPVVLATLAVPFDGDAARVAFQAALESDVKLIVIDSVERPLWIQSTVTGHADLEEDDDRDQIRRMVRHAADLGLEVEHVRVRSPRPVDALLEVAGEHQAGLLVFGPDRSRFRPRRFARVVRRIRKRASCLLCVAGEGP